MIDLKGMVKRAKDPAIQIGLVTVGAIAGKKFLDFKTMFPNEDPTKWWIKHEGAVKVVIALVGIMAWKNMPMIVKYLLIGLAVQGAITEIRQLTMGDNGKAFFEQIGNNEETMNQALERIANEVKESAKVNGSENESQVGADEYGSQVGMWELNGMGFSWNEAA